MTEACSRILLADYMYLGSILILYPYALFILWMVSTACSQVLYMSLVCLLKLLIYPGIYIP